MIARGEDNPDGAAHDIDLMTAWTLVGRDTPNAGVFVATTEYREKLGNDPASSVGPDLGTLINTTNAFNDREWVLRDAYWLQRLLDGKLRILFGRADTSDFVGQQPMQNVNSSFVNRSFSANPSVPFPGHGATLGVSVRPNSEFYVTGGLANGYNDTTAYEFDTISHTDFFYALEGA
jgi:carbohydrate-selective porin OprB